MSIDTISKRDREHRDDVASATAATRERLPRNMRGAIGDQCPAQYPTELLSASCLAVGHDPGCRNEWWLAHTRPQQEKALAAALYSRRVPYYVPLITRKSLVRGRTRVARIPLFPGYVFVRGSRDDRLQVLQTKRVLTVREVADGEQLRFDLAGFAKLIALDAPLVRESRLEAGERVRVKAGPFRDNEGVVLRRNGKTRLLVAINYLQQGASLEIDDCLLEPL